MITVETRIRSDVKKVWEYWTSPQHIMNWNYASDDWHCPAASNDLQKGGTFSFTMASKDGKMSFDFEGKYNEIEEFSTIRYQITDGRAVEISFSQQGEETIVLEKFEAEKVNSEELQKSGWQAILDNFKRYVEQSA